MEKNPKRIRLNNAATVVLNLLVFGVIFSLPHMGLIQIPFGYAIVLTVVIWLRLKQTRENFTDLGFSFKRFEWKSVLIGFCTAVACFAFLQYAFFPVLNHFIVIEKARLDDFSMVRHHPEIYVLFVLLSFVVGGFYEELAFHGFMFTRLEKMLPLKYRTLIAFILTNLVFALYHYQLGTGGVINAFLAGSTYHAVMLKYNRNLWYAFFAHGFFDCIAFTYIFLGYW